MTQDEIIRMAREAGIGRTNTGMEFIEKLERFAALVAEATKEKVYQAIRDAETPYTQLTLGQQKMIKEVLK